MVFPTWRSECQEGLFRESAGLCWFMLEVVMFWRLRRVVAAGAVHVLFGTVNGPTDVNGQRWTEFSPNLPPALGIFFGGAVAVGDFNGDTFQDLAIGFPGESNGGAVIVLFGSFKTGLVAPS